MIHSKTRMLAAAACVAIVAAACSSSSKSSTTSSSASSSSSSASSSSAPASSSSASGSPSASHTVTVGLITDVTSLGASGNKTSVEGMEAAVVLAKRDGWTLKYIVADDATNPATALAAAQKLVDQDHVTAIIAVSSVLFGGTNFLTTQNVPVIGAAEDGPEWLTAKNMFSSYGAQDETKVSTDLGQLYKMLGATKIGAVGYSISPSSSEAAKGGAASAIAAGLQAPYLNAQFPFGSTNVQPIALAMKNDGVDGLVAPLDANTSFAIVTAMRQLGDPLKAAVLATGYGGDLQQAGANAAQVAQGVYFYTSFEPAEMQTAATKQIESDLNAVGVTSDPTYAEYSAYTSVGLLLQALTTTGPNPTHAALISALSNITSWNALGLFDNHPINPSDRDGPTGTNNCIFVTKFSGTTFQLVPNADPLCGTNIPGKTVSASS
jgi:ABC-type branched-subunit amino acid transport system substrate-binding protein